MAALRRAPAPNQEKKMVLLEFAMAPHGQGESLSAHVARILDVIDRSGVRYQLTPMGTILEGEWDEVMAVVTACLPGSLSGPLRGPCMPSMPRTQREY